MTKQDKSPGKNRKNLTKNDLPVLDSDQDLLSAFMEPYPLSSSGENDPGEKNKPSHPEKAIPRLNKHGLPVIEDVEGQFLAGEQEGLSDPAQKELREAKGLRGPRKSGETIEQEEVEENFELLLEASLKQRKSPGKKKITPIPLKKRLRRYPPPEADLDLHGYTALGAELKAKSFILTCKHEGYFSLRIIVGKGLHSDIGPVLPDVIEDLLRILEKQNIVLAYKWDQQLKSKSGAVIIYLKQFDD